MYNFMCEYTGASHDIIVCDKVLKKGLKAMLKNVQRKDFLNILKAQENGWLKIHGSVTFEYRDANKAMELYNGFAEGTEKDILLAQLIKLAEENKNTFEKNKDLEKFVAKMTEEPAVEEPVEEPVAEEPAVKEPAVEEPVAEEPVVEEPVVEEPVVEEPVVEEPAEKSKRTRKTKKSADA